MAERVRYQRLHKVVLRLKNCEGSVTLEATIIFPAILLIIFGLIFLSMYVYQKLIVLNAVTYTAAERASTWENSRRDLETGSLKGSLATDGLYWRIFDDFSVSALVTTKASDSKGFANQLLSQGSAKPKSPIQIVMGYQNTIFKRTVSVHIKQNLLKPFFAPGLINPGLSQTAKADVAEPVEFVRNFDFGLENLTQLTNFIKQMDSGNAEQTKPEPVIVSIKSNVNGQSLYHYSGCRYISQIKQENYREYASAEDAVKGGFHICKECGRTKLGQK